MKPVQPDIPDRPAVVAVAQWRRSFWTTGVIMIVIGFLAIIMPVLSTFAVNFLIGGILTISGLLAVMVAVSLRGSRAFVPTLIAGLFPLSIGLYLLFFPAAGLIALTGLIAAILIVTGISQGAFAFEIRGTTGWGWVVMSSLISIALGVMIFAVLPEASRVLLGTILGIDLISTGFALVFISKSTESSA